MNKSPLLRLLIFILALGMLSCSKEAEIVEEETPASVISFTKKQMESAKIELGAYSTSKMSSRISSNGIVDVPPQYKAMVSTSIGGFVKSTEVLEGDHVNKGEVLAVLTHPDYVQLQEQFLELRSRYILAEKQFNRQKELREENINSARKLEEAETDLKISNAQVKAVEAKLKMIGLDPVKISDGSITSGIEIRSPITGDVATVNTSLGKFVKPEEVMFEVISKEHLHLDLKVYEKDVLKIKEGQKIQYSVGNDLADRPAKVILVGKKLDLESRTVSVHAHPEKSAGLLPGMYVRASIFSEEKQVMALPEEALVKEGDKNYIFIKSSMEKEIWSFKKIPVEIGTSAGGLVEIKSPSIDAFKNNIVLKGAYFINSHAAMQNAEEE